MQIRPPLRRPTSTSTRGARSAPLGPIDRTLVDHNCHRAHHEIRPCRGFHVPRNSAARPAFQRRGFLLWSYLKMWRGPRTAKGPSKSYAPIIRCLQTTLLHRISDALAQKVAASGFEHIFFGRRPYLFLSKFNATLCSGLIRCR